MGLENGFCYSLVGRRRCLSRPSRVKSIWVTDTEAIRMMPRFDNSGVGPEVPAVQPDRLFRGFLEAAPDAVVIIDGEGAIVQVNSQTEKMFGYRREELVSRPVEVLMPERFRARTSESAGSFPLIRTRGPWAAALSCSACERTAASFRSMYRSAPCRPRRESL